MLNTILLIIMALNSFLVLVLMLAIYSKVDTLIEIKEVHSQAILDFVRGFSEGIKDFVSKKAD